MCCNLVFAYHRKLNNAQAPLIPYNVSLSNYDFQAASEHKQHQSINSIRA